MKSTPLTTDASLLVAALLGALSFLAMLSLSRATEGPEAPQADASEVRAAEPKVTLHLLDHTKKLKTETRFWIDWNDEWQGITKTKTVTGKIAEAIIAQLEKSLLAEESDNLCGHHPIYGIEVTRQDGSTLKTSLCFSCNTWVKPKKRLAIEAEYGAQQPLAKTLRAVIELPKEVLEGKAGKP